MDRWKKSMLLGEGAYGKVFLANKRDTEIAVKSAYVKDGESYRSLKDEGSFLKQLNGEPYVIRCFGKDRSVENGRKTYNLLLEYAARGNLYDLILGSPQMDARQVAYFTRMLLIGLSRIHANGIAHCDLKPDNILVFRTNGQPDQLKIADFGQAIWVSSPEEPYESEENYWNRGTTIYASPESVEKGEHGTFTDIWSLGITVAEMMNPGRHFFDEYDEIVSLYDQIVHQPLELKQRVPYNFDQYAVDFLEMCLDKNPKNRWSAQQLLKHPFITRNLNGTSPHSFDHQIKAENPIKGSREWVSVSDLFTYAR